MNTYERRAGGEVVERVTNIRPGTPRDRELAGLVITDARRTRDGWYLVGIGDQLADEQLGDQLGAEPLDAVRVDQLDQLGDVDQADAAGVGEQAPAGEPPADTKGTKHGKSA